MNDRERVREIFLRALSAVEAEGAVSRSLKRNDPGEGPFVVVGSGKAVCAMARGAERILGERIVRGEVVTKDGHAVDLERIEVFEASHPLPDSRGLVAARSALETARSLAPPEQLLVLLSGGASALWPLPVPEISLEDKRETSDLLLRAGCDIAGLNTVRKHLSQIKGGALARAAHPASCLTLAVSDVAGDRSEWIGSGPTVADSSSFDDALAVLRRARVMDRIPEAVRSRLEAGNEGRREETPKPGEPIFDRSELRIVARLADALAAAEQEAARQSLGVLGLGEVLHGDVRDVARRLAREARGLRGSEPAVLIAGGEPTVHVVGTGEGGRAQELALAFLLELGEETGGVTALFAGTDGSDGPTDAAGAVVDGGSLQRMRAGGCEPESLLARNDSYPALTVSGDLLRTGPTDTNVTDLALILVRPTGGMG